MKEFTIYYNSTEEKGLFVGNAYGETTEEAIEDFLFWHGEECAKIVEVV